MKLSVGDLVRIIHDFRRTVVFTKSHRLDDDSVLFRLNSRNVGIITRVDPLELRYQMITCDAKGSFTCYVHPDWVDLVRKNMNE